MHRNQRAGCRFDTNLSDGPHAVSGRLRETQDQLKSSLALIHVGRGLPADRRDNELLHIGHINAIAGDLLPVDIDREIRLTGDLFHFDVFDALNVLHRPSQFLPPCRAAHQGRVQTV